MNFALARNSRNSTDDKEDDDMITKNEEWNRIMKNTMLSNEFKSTFTTTTNFNRELEISKSSPSPTDLSKNTKKRVSPPISPNSFNNSDDLESQILAKKIYQNKPNYAESLTEQLADRKRGKYGNAKGFSIENLIGRIVEDR